MLGVVVRPPGQADWVGVASRLGGRGILQHLEEGSVDPARWARARARAGLPARNIRKKAVREKDMT